MKKIILLLLISLLFANCEKETKYIDVQILSIVSDNDNSYVYYKVINNSDFDISARIYFDIDGTKQIGWISDCYTYKANEEISDNFISSGLVYSVDCKIKTCAI